MRVLITLLPATGSLHPLVPLAIALVDAGHEVRFACASSFEPDVAQHVFVTHAAGLDFRFSDPDYFPVLVRAAGVDAPDMTQLDGYQRNAWVTNNLFIGAAARAMLPDVLEIARAWRADLIVRESSEFSGCVAAERLGIPHASVAAAADAALDLRHVTASALDGLRSEAGLTPDPAAEMVYRHVHLSFMPAAFFGPDADFPVTTHFVRHLDAPRPGSLVPHWWHTLPERPTVLVSLGTIFFRTPGLYDAIIDGLSGEGLNVVIGVGQHDGSSPDQLRRAPDVHVEPYLDLPLLLRHSALLLTHGGFNSIKEAASAGVPTLVVPIASDQHYSADRVEALGTGRVVRPHERSASRIREQALAVLTEPAYGTAAAALAGEMAALLAIDHAVALLEQLVSSPS